MTQPTTLPPLRIMYLDDVSRYDKFSEQNSCIEKIEWILRYQHDFKKVNEKTLEGYTVHTYRSIATAPSLAIGFGDEDFEDEEPKQSPEYLVFLFNQTLGSHVYVLSTPKAFKAIRLFCSHQFPMQCYDHFSSQLSSIDKVSFRQIFSPVAESTLSLIGPFQHNVNQETQVYRHCRAIFKTLPEIEGSDIKIEFSERSILVYRDLTLSDYAKLLKKLPLTNNASGLNFTGLPDNSLTSVQNQHVLTTLSDISSRYVAGFNYYNFLGWKFNLELSDKWCSNGYKFRLYQESSQEAFPLTDTEKDSPLKLEDVWNRTCCTPEQVYRGELLLQHKTISSQWYSMPLLDCIEGWVTSPEGQLFFKVDRAWYQIESKCQENLSNQLKEILDIRGLVLKPMERGYLNLLWESKTEENDYNRLYTTNTQYPRSWYDGNLKRILSFELFDILQIYENDVFIYHVKKNFNTSVKVAGAQLHSSAQLIQSCRIRSSDHPDRMKLAEYCNRAGEESALYLQDALLNKKLHFVLAFRFINEPINEMIQNNSLSAKFEIIKTHEAITSVNKDFQFHISPIQAAQAKSINVPKLGLVFQITYDNYQHFVNGYLANWDGNFYIWKEPNGEFAINSEGRLFSHSSIPTPNWEPLT